MKLSYSTLCFADLNLDQLYQLMKLRQEVFVVEQDCPYLDADDKDQESFHVLGVDEHKTVHAYTRLVPKGLSYQNYISIGRVVNSMASRGQGIGIELMEVSISSSLRLWPNIPIKISAQSHLQQFYQKFDFESVGEGYLEDGIPHIAMVRK